MVSFSYLPYLDDRGRGVTPHSTDLCRSERSYLRGERGFSVLPAPQPYVYERFTFIYVKVSRSRDRRSPVGRLVRTNNQTVALFTRDLVSDFGGLTIVCPTVGLRLERETSTHRHLNWTLPKDEDGPTIGPKKTNKKERK